MKNFFDELENSSRALKLSIYFNVGQFFVLILSIFMLALVSQTKIVSVEIPPGDHTGETFKIGASDANDRSYEVWGEVFSNRVGNYSPTTFKDKFKALEPFLYPDNHFQIKTEFESAGKKIAANFISSKFEFKFAKVERENGIAKVKAYGTATRMVGTRTEFENMPYVYEIDMVVKNSNIFITRIAGKIDESNLVGDSGKGSMYKSTSKFVDFQGLPAGIDTPSDQEQPKK